MSEIKLTEENVISLLKRYVDQGYKASKVLSIKEGALLHKVFRFLEKVEVDSKMTVKEAYGTVFKAIEVSNTESAYDMNDAAVIDRLTTFVQDKVLVENQESTITEI